MIDNKDKICFYKDSNAGNFFNRIKELIMTVKLNYDENLHNLYSNYIKNLSYIFYIINLNLLGVSICKEGNIENIKEEINSIYKEYIKIVTNIYISLENFFPKIDNFIENIRDCKNPQQESQTLSEEIIKITEQHYKYLDTTIKEYQKKMEGIRHKVIENEIQNNFMNVSYDKSIYKNFFSKAHVMEHSFLGVGSLIAFFFGPIGWAVSISSHILLLLGNFAYDSYKKVDTIVENMENFKKNLKIKFDGDKKDKILDYMYKLKQNIEKEIELIVNSQNSEFRGIRDNKKAFDDIINKFKEICKIK